jgi:hypothetical protein
MGIRLVSYGSSILNRYTKNLSADESTRANTEFKNSGSVVLKNTAYKRQYIISGNTLKSNDTSLDDILDFHGDGSGTYGTQQLKSAFGSTLKNTRMNKKLLCDFVEVIA